MNQITSMNFTKGQADCCPAQYEMIWYALVSFSADEFLV